MVYNSALNNIFILFWQFWYLSDDEYVVDADAEKDEGDDGVSSRIEQAKHWAQPVRQDHTLVGNSAHFSNKTHKLQFIYSPAARIRQTWEFSDTQLFERSAGHGVTAIFQKVQVRYLKKYLDNNS